MELVPEDERIEFSKYFLITLHLLNLSATGYYWGTSIKNFYVAYKIFEPLLYLAFLILVSEFILSYTLSILLNLKYLGVLLSLNIVVII